MITKYSSASAKYDSLFEEATNRLNELGVKQRDENGVEGDLYDYEKGIRIDTLEEYFSNLRNLIYGPANNELQPGVPEDFAKIQEGYKFLKLPVDEPHFKINADTRVIEVPNEFKKNGVSVVGDEVSEILFFEIDRFYDATDLSLLDIGFFWSYANDSDHTVYQTPAFFSVVETDYITGDDKLIFGWPISSDITKQAGKISFSVRFYQKDISVIGNDTYSLIYSLSTLPQTININAGLVYDIKNVSVDNRLDLILGKRIVNSPMGKQYPPEKPVLVFARTRKGLEILENNFDINEQITGDITFAVLGFKEDNGSLTYSWQRKEADGSIIPLTDFKAPSLYGDFIKTNKFIQTQEGQKIVVYYWKYAEYDYRKILIEDEAAFERESSERDLYVQCSTYTLTTSNVFPGQYFTKVTNTLNKQENTNYEESMPPYVWTVHGPTLPDITKTSWGDADIIELITDLVLSVEGNNLVNSQYLWEADLTATSEITEGYVWQSQSTEATCPVSKEGYYRVTVTNSQNGETLFETTDPVLVLAPIAAVTPTAMASGNTLILNLGRGTSTLEPFETISCTWYDEDSNEIATTNSLSYEFDFNAANTSVKFVITKGEFKYEHNRFVYPN